MIESMKQALEALENTLGFTGSRQIDSVTRQAITSLRQAIAEAEKQEPVRVTIKDFVKAVEGKEEMVGRPVYWAQWPNNDPHPQPKRKWFGLTDEEIQNIAFDAADRESAIIQAEAKIKEKNT